MATGAAVGTLAYSLLTRYELGPKKLLPMPVHLALEAASGALLCAAPTLLLEEDGGPSPPSSPRPGPRPSSVERR